MEKMRDVMVESDENFDGEMRVMESDDIYVGVMESGDSCGGVMTVVVE